MARIILLLLSALHQRRLAQYEAALAGAQGGGWRGPATRQRPAGSTYRLHGPAAAAAPQAEPREAAGAPGWDAGAGPDGWTQVLPSPQLPPPGRPRRRWIPRWVKWSVFLVLVGLVFRRAVASVVMMALSAGPAPGRLERAAAAHPVRLALADGQRGPGTSNVELGPWVLQKIEGISKPALGTENFNFVFTHKVSKNIGPWPCWYSSTFYAVGHASATVNLNPGPSWWTAAAGHYQLQVLSRPAGGQPGRVSIVMVLPPPQLPQNVHDVSIDNTLSKPLSTAHSWTYPGLGCGALIKPQFAPSVVYDQAQQEAFYRVGHVSSVTRPLISTAESQASQIIRNNFIQPTVNALGYTLGRFTLRWAAAG